MPNKEKIDQVAILTETFRNAPSVAVTDYSGLTVEKATILRKELRQKHIKYLVAKNTLLRIAAKEAGINGLDDFLTGPSAVAFGTEEAGVMTKILYDFGKQHQKPTIKAIYLDGKLYSGAEADRIAKLPGKEILMSMLVGSITAPIQSFIGTLDAVIRDLVGTIDAVKEKMSN